MPRNLLAFHGRHCPVLAVRCESGASTREALVRGARLRAFSRHDLVAAHMVRIAAPGALINVVAMHGIPSVVDLAGLDDGRVALWRGDLVLTLARRDAGLGLDLLGLALAGAEGLLQRIDRMTFDSVRRRLARILWVRHDLLFDRDRPLLGGTARRGRHRGAGQRGGLPGRRPGPLTAANPRLAPLPYPRPPRKSIAAAA